ncbi:unnamed protein product [Gordionus sp. m RMFG-2023]
MIYYKLDILCQNSPFLHEPEDVSISVGGSVILKCVIRPDVGRAFWVKDGVALYDLTNNDRYSYIGNQNKGVYNLLIDNALMNQDSGRWQCAVTNGYPQTSRSAILNVVQKYTNIEKPHTIAYYKPSINQTAAFHYCTQDRILVTFDFPFRLNITLIGRGSECSLQIYEMETVSLFIPYYDCKTTIASYKEDSQVHFSSNIMLKYGDIQITYYFSCAVPRYDIRKYYTTKRRVFDLSPQAVPYKRSLPNDCPIRINNTEFTTKVTCDRNSFTISLLFLRPFTGIIKIPENGECFHQITDQRNFTKSFGFDHCGSQKLSQIV